MGKHGTRTVFTKPNGEKLAFGMGQMELCFIEHLFKDWETPFRIVATQA
jgi:hypothetical protein